MYQKLNATLITVIATIINIFLGIGIMMKGWGLEPTSWAWIIGGGLLTSIIAASVTHLTLGLFGDMPNNELK